MAVKTITVTEDAYAAMKKIKEEHESFSDLFLRVSKRRPLSDFFGILSPEGGAELEKNILEMRRARNKVHTKRVGRVIAELSKAHH
ncbi:antitoxin VapB family protein [Candidatus Woesearchaeota archaeon]|nr:antitoxin VapB family protein [Candidatus Woesearchaeota archaeon]